MANYTSQYADDAMAKHGGGGGEDKANRMKAEKSKRSARREATKTKGILKN